MDEEKLFYSSVLIAHDGQNDEVKIEDGGSLEWKRMKMLKHNSYEQQIEGLVCS